jgi:tetratricopeptide (TPR) repeat protein
MAAVTLEDLVAELRAVAPSADEQPAFDDEVALALDELARVRLSEGRPEAAQELVTEALSSRVSKADPSQQPLAAQLLGHLGAAQLKRGRPQRALEATDEALALLASSSSPLARPAGVPSGLAEVASGSMQDILMVRVRAKGALGQCRSAQEDLDTLLRLQDELWASTTSARERWRAAGPGTGPPEPHPDPHLRGAMARSRLLTGELALEGCMDQGDGAEAAPSPAQATTEQAAQQALKILEAVDELPVGPEIATPAEVQALLAKARALEPTDAGKAPVRQDINASAATAAAAAATKATDKLETETATLVEVSARAG